MTASMQHSRFDDMGVGGEAPKPKMLRSDTVIVRTLGKVDSAMRKQLMVIVMSAVFSVITITAVMLSRSSHVETSEFVDRNGNIIGSGQITVTSDLVELPSLRDWNFYDEMNSAMIEDSSGSTMSLRISSWTWHNASRMQLDTFDGVKILIDAGTAAFAGPVDTLLTQISADGTAAAVGQQAHDAAKLAPSMVLASGRCLSLGCPFLRCSAGLAAGGLVREVGCDGRPLWRWPQGVSLHAQTHSSASRNLNVGKWSVKKVKSAGGKA